MPPISGKTDTHFPDQYRFFIVSRAVIMGWYYETFVKVGRFRVVGTLVKIEIDKDNIS